MNISFICTGNTCRSPMACALFKSLDTRGRNAISRGLSHESNIPVSKNAVLAMEELGIDISAHKSKQVRYEDIEESDLILTMGRFHKDAILNMNPNAKLKVFTIYEYALGLNKEVADPFMQSVEVYKKSRDELKMLVEAVLKRLEENE